MRFRSNPLLMWTSIIIGLYFLASTVIGGVWISAFTSATLLVAGTIMALTALPDAYQILRKGDIGPGELAVIGITVLATGSVYTGAFGVLWAIAGNPHNWVGTWYSSFGRLLNTLGFALVYLSPDATRRGVKPPRWYVIMGGMIVVALISFYLGIQMDIPINK